MFRCALIFALAGAVAIDVKKAPRTVMEPDVAIFEAPRWARGERVTGDEPVTLNFFLKHCPYQLGLCINQNATAPSRRPPRHRAVRLTG